MSLGIKLTPTQYGLCSIIAGDMTPPPLPADGVVRCKNILEFAHAYKEVLALFAQQGRSTDAITADATGCILDVTAVTPL
jgi:hypothetical protein